MLFYFPPHRTYVHIYVRVYGCLCLLLVFLEERRADKKHFVFKFHWMRHCMQIFCSWFLGGHFVTVYRTHTATMSVSRSAAAQVNKNRVYSRYFSFQFLLIWWGWTKMLKIHIKYDLHYHCLYDVCAYSTICIRFTKGS